MISIGEALQKKIDLYSTNDPVLVAKRSSTEYQKEWARAVQFFQIRLNKDRKRDKMPELSFIAVRQKLVALREVDDLRWFYKQCCEYARKKDPARKIRYTFSMCFFGATKIK